jgi:hemoglobin
MALEQITVYELVGGQETFVRLADTFYRRIETDPFLRPMFPADLAGASERLALFLIQYFGGPTTYSERRGHPRLRMRHIPFSIGQAERDAWLGHMLAAIDLVGIAEPARTQMRDYFERSATFMINRTEEAQS